MALSGSAAPSVVAAGVAEALVTTAAGLVVAVPAVLLYNHFARRMSVMLTVAENHARTLREVLLESDTQRGSGTSSVSSVASTIAYPGSAAYDIDSDSGDASSRAA
jgi:biopolymer transport protein ExbB